MKPPGMNRTLALALQGIIALFAGAVLAFLLVEPHFEGRNAHATTFEVYFHDPFLAYVYLGSIPFFVALYRTGRLLGDVRRNGEFSTAALDDLRVIRRCAFILIGFVAGAAVFIVINGDPDDRPAGVVMCALVTLSASFIAAAASRFAGRLRRALAER